ncbi:MAG: hypothetical protein KDD70_09825 [Bdellovibrionales bacterium]|nr:hypothetical protein [Bdellovibrionales bacterium]
MSARYTPDRSRKHLQEGIEGNDISLTAGELIASLTILERSLNSIGAEVRPLVLKLLDIAGDTAQELQAFSTGAGPTQLLEICRDSLVQYDELSSDARKKELTDEDSDVVAIFDRASMQFGMSISLLEQIKGDLDSASSDIVKFGRAKAKFVEGLQILTKSLTERDAPEE